MRYQTTNYVISSKYTLEYKLFHFRREGSQCECKSSEDKMNHIQRFANTELRKEKKIDNNGLLPNDYFKGKVRNER